MTREKIGKSGRRYLIIESEPDAVCELCGKLDELRPYGPGGKSVCFPCAMLPENKAEAERRLNTRLDGIQR